MARGGGEREPWLLGASARALRLGERLTLVDGDLLDASSLRAAVENRPTRGALPPCLAVVRSRLVGEAGRDAEGDRGSTADAAGGRARQRLRGPASGSPRPGRCSARPRRARNARARRAGPRPRTRSPSWPHTSSSGRCARTTSLYACSGIVFNHESERRPAPVRDPHDHPRRGRRSSWAWPSR